MPQRDNWLITEFNTRRSEDAFAALVRQHVHLVFATAVRQVGNGGAAEEITQNVFVALAQTAGKLGAHPTIAGWLHQTALNKSREWLRGELRRRRREERAVDLASARAEGDSVWSPLVPLLDEALLELHEPDRAAVIMHFMEGQTFHEVGFALGVGEDAARKRVNRCLDQLTRFFRRRGFAVPVVAADAPLFALSSHAAPAGLAATATAGGVAAAHSATATLNSTLIKGALKLMAYGKLNIAVAAGAVLFLAGGTATVIQIKHIQDEALWRAARLSNMKPMLILRPTRFADAYPHGYTYSDGNRFRKQCQSLTNLLQAAYGFSPQRMSVTTTLPNGRFDCLDTEFNPQEALQSEIRRRFRLAAYAETRTVDVLLLEPNGRGDGPGLETARHPDGGGGAVAHLAAGMKLFSAPMSTLTANLEDLLGTPVIDQTGLSGQFDMDLEWKRHGVLSDVVNTALNDQLGLKLVPGTAPVKMLVIEKAK
jgi:uncharacterized protein (TIGR03435 family)